MKFAVPFKTLLLSLGIAALSACGGGGGGGPDGVLPQKIQATATAQSTSIGIDSSTDITVRATQQSGAAVADGSTVQATVSPGLGNIAPLNGTSVTTQGGNAVFRFRSGGQTGTTTITFTVRESGTQLTATASVTITITATPTGDPRLVITPERSTLPINARNVPPFLGSPYMTEVTFMVRNARGEPLSDDGLLQVSLNPVGNTGGFSTLDDPATTENEITVRIAQGPVDVESGKGTVLVHSLNFSGTTVLTASFQDPVNNQIVSATHTFTIAATTLPVPSSITLNSSSPIYVTGSGGNTSGQVEAVVLDGIGQPVPDPQSGNNRFNNLRLEIVGDDNGERLSGLNAAGQGVSGRSISIATVAGIGGANFIAGSRTGNFVVRATADRADNNVDNGIQDAVTTDRTVVVSDGRLFSLEITSPLQNAINVNPIVVDPDVVVTPGQNPNDPDGTYSLTVSVIATDRQGNPVIPGTRIRFGLIDEPQVDGTGVFQIEGNDGNPQEGGTLFTAPTGHFTTAGGGAGPGDTLALFGKEVDGNRDHESTRVIASVTSATSLTVQRRFNNNDDTGASVNSGNVLPYVIGRAVTGNIEAEAVTNSNGVATTQMNYPVSAVGKRIVLWAQGDGDEVNGTFETVADVDRLAFPGIADLQLTATPSSIPASGTYPVTLCVTDALDSPIQAVRIAFTFEGVSGTVDDVSGSGFVGTPTGTDGCTVAMVRAVGVPEGGGSVFFSVGDQTAEVEIVAQTLVLQASPSVITTSSRRVILTLLNSAGQPQPGYQITADCSGENGTTVAYSNGPGVTDANGQTTVDVTSTNLDQIGQAGSGECTFETVGGDASITVQIIGQDLCETPVSPTPEGCSEPEQVTVTLQLVATATTGFTVTSSPSGITCTVPNGGTQSCTGDFDENTGIQFTTLPATTGPEVTWTGACAPADGANPDDVGTAQVGTSNITCTATRP